MKKKKCFKCFKVLSLDRFYKHQMMLDGHLNKCIDCAKKDIKERTKLLRETNPEWIAQERKRGREKYYRLNYGGKKQSYKMKKEIMAKYQDKYPERVRAKNVSQHIKIKEGYNRHHWSYNEEHFKDIIELSIQDHNKLHRYMIYDQERRMFRTTKNILLDTKEKHLKYFDQIKSLE